MTHLQKITTLAKKIRKAKPALKWTDAIKQASKQIKPAAKKAAKKIGALPIGFKGSIWGVNFKVVNQYDIYNNVSAIVEDIKTGSTIVVFDGKGSASTKADQMANYIAKYAKVDFKIIPQDISKLKGRLIKFTTNMQKEVNSFNAGKNKTIKKQPLVIAAPKKTAAPVKKTAPKKSAKKVHTIWKTVPEHKRRVAGSNDIKIDPLKVYAEHLRRIKYFNVQIIKCKLLLKSVTDSFAKAQITNDLKVYQKQLQITKKMAAMQKRLI